MAHERLRRNNVVGQHLIDGDARPRGRCGRVDDSLAMGQERSAREIDRQRVKAARGSGGFRRFDCGGARCGDHLKAGLGQPAGNVAPQKATRSGDQHPHGRSAHGGENLRHRNPVRR